MSTISRPQTPRQQRVAQAAQLRRAGRSVSEIAALLGASRSSVSTWLTDPDLSKQRARRERYRGACVDCGRPTCGSKGRERAPKRCLDCSRTFAREQALVERRLRTTCRSGHPLSGIDEQDYYLSVDKRGTPVRVCKRCQSEATRRWIERKDFRCLDCGAAVTPSSRPRRCDACARAARRRVDRAEVRRLHSEGLSSYAIARQLGCDPSTTRLIIAKERES